MQIPDSIRAKLTDKERNLVRIIESLPEEDQVVIAEALMPNEIIPVGALTDEGPPDMRPSERQKEAALGVFKLLLSKSPWYMAELAGSTVLLSEGTLGGTKAMLPFAKILTVDDLTEMADSAERQNLSTGMYL